MFLIEIGQYQNQYKNSQKDKQDNKISKNKTFSTLSKKVLDFFNWK